MVYDKPVFENTRIARNNEILRLLLLRLEDPETLTSRITPGGFKDHSKAAKQIRVLQQTLLRANGELNHEAINQAMESEDTYKPEYNPLSPLAIIDINQQNQIAGTIIGIAANNNVNHIMAELMARMEIRDPNTNKIEFCGHHGTSFIAKSDSHDPRNVNHALAEYLASSVDAVKDPVLNFLNINRDTANAAFVLARLGFTSEEIGLFLNQPIIMQTCTNLNGDRYLRTMENAIASVKKEYNLPVGKVALTKESLMKAISQTSRMSKESLKTYLQSNPHQATVLQMFLTAVELGRELTQFINATKFTAANSLGSSFGSLYHNQFVTDKWMELASSDEAKISIVTSNTHLLPITSETSLSPFLSKDSIGLYLSSILDNPMGFEQCMYDTQRAAIQALCQQFYPYESKFYKKTRNAMNGITRSQTLSEDTINSIHHDIQKWVLQQFRGSWFDGRKKVYLKSINKEFSQEDFFVNEFPKILKESKSVILEYFDIYRTTLEEPLTIQLKDASLLESTDKDTFKILWENMAKSDNLEDRNLARSLYLHFWYKFGYTPTYRSIVDLAPPAVLDLLKLQVKNPKSNTIDAVSYLSFLQSFIPNEAGESLTDRFSDRYLDFIFQYIRNNSDDYQFTSTVRKQAEVAILNRNHIIENNQDYLKFDMETLSEAAPELANKIRIRTAEMLTVYIPAIKFEDKAGNTHFYELDLQKSNATYLEGVGLVTTKNPVYRKVDISADVETQNIHLEGTQELLADSLIGTVDQDALLQEARESLGWIEIGEGELQLKDYTQPDRTYLTQTGEEKPHC